MVYPAKAIANFFIKKARSEVSFEKINDLSPMKLLKLIYIAHGWNLAINGNGLIEEDIEAWPYGPVINSVYQDFKHFGNNAITEETEELIVDNEGNVKINKFDPHFDHETLALLQRVWEVYKVNSAIQLSNWSHLPGSPWDKTWNNLQGRRYKGMSISNVLIKEYFSDELRKAKNGNSEKNR